MTIDLSKDAAFSLSKQTSKNLHGYVTTLLTAAVNARARENQQVQVNCADLEALDGVLQIERALNDLTVFF